MDYPLDDLVEEITPTLTRQYLHNRRLVVFTAYDISQPTVDAWVATVEESIKSWNFDTPLLNMHNLLPINTMSLTPYARKRAAELMDNLPNLRGRSAIILPPSMVTKIVQLFLKTQRNRARERQIFFNYERGMTWLEELLP